jgi:hypothetical protein
MVRFNRRRLLAIGASACAVPALAFGEDATPAELDHVLLGARDLTEGIAFLERHTGVRAVFGGVHPNRGTQNALASLGSAHYLEVIALDPAQAAVHLPITEALAKLSEPRLVGWAVHTHDLEGVKRKLERAGIPFEGPASGSRKRPDNRMLKWRTLMLSESAKGDSLLPFFIEWSRDSVHPATDAPKGCRLSRFELVTPEPDALRKTLAVLSLTVSVAKGDAPRIRATFEGPKGRLDVSS